MVDTAIAHLPRCFCLHVPSTTLRAQRGVPPTGKDASILRLELERTCCFASPGINYRGANSQTNASRGVGLLVHLAPHGCRAPKLVRAPLVSNLWQIIEDTLSNLGATKAPTRPQESPRGPKIRTKI